MSGLIPIVPSHGLSMVSSIIQLSELMVTMVLSMADVSCLALLKIGGAQRISMNSKSYAGN